MTDIIKLGISIILIGFAAVFIGTILSAGNADFGGLIMIGPVPIAFGSSPEITVIAMVTGLLLMLVFFLAASGVMFSRREDTGQKEEEDTTYGNSGEKKIKGGGVILIGPVPVVFGSDKRFALIVMILTIVILLLWIVFNLTFPVRT